MSEQTFCTRCRQTISAQKWASHICSPKMTAIEEILVEYFYETNREGERHIIAKGMNGIFYRLIQPSENPSVTPRELTRTRRFDHSPDKLTEWGVGSVHLEGSDFF